MIKMFLIICLVFLNPCIDDIVSLQLRQQFVSNANQSVKEINELINSIKTIIK